MYRPVHPRKEVTSNPVVRISGPGLIEREGLYRTFVVKLGKDNMLGVYHQRARSIPIVLLFDLTALDQGGQIVGDCLYLVG